MECFWRGILVGYSGGVFNFGVGSLCHTPGAEYGAGFKMVVGAENGHFPRKFLCWIPIIFTLFGKGPDHRPAAYNTSDLPNVFDRSPKGRVLGPCLSYPAITAILMQTCPSILPWANPRKSFENIEL